MCFRSAFSLCSSHSLYSFFLYSSVRVFTYFSVLGLWSESEVNPPNGKALSHLLLINEFLVASVALATRLVFAAVKTNLRPRTHHL